MNAPVKYFGVPQLDRKAASLMYAASRIVGMTTNATAPAGDTHQRPRGAVWLDVVTGSIWDMTVHGKRRWLPE